MNADWFQKGTMWNEDVCCFVLKINYVNAESFYWNFHSLNRESFQQQEA